MRPTGPTILRFIVVPLFFVSTAQTSVLKTSVSDALIGLAGYWITRTNKTLSVCCGPQLLRMSIMTTAYWLVPPFTLAPTRRRLATLLRLLQMLRCKLSSLHSMGTTRPALLSSAHIAPRRPWPCHIYLYHNIYC